MQMIEFMYINLAVAILIFARINGIFVTAPFFGSRNISAKLRIGLSLLLTILILPSVLKLNIASNYQEANLLYFSLVVGEFLVGLIIGFVANIFFSVAQMAGQVLDMQIGFGMVNVLDPQSGQQMPVIGNFLNILAVLVFLTTNAHHFLLISLNDSFSVISLGAPNFQAGILAFALEVFKKTFVIAFKFCLPIATVILLTDIALGMLSKTMPQMNIFIVGMPAKIILGIFMLSAILPTYIYVLKVGFDEIYKDVQNIIRILA
ncbi:flagellar biosynthetic protein FliR [Succinispira mobilis]|uniref:flagellar biosynthetic protein FliR n=1 Tax=Succinispira mobilis TaxID=78120 RepID=UPI00037865CB|nr:flagellar biosynthetic protein FliR [Succinispira mobilis]